MPSWAEALAAIQGLKRLFRFDAGFVQWFDRSYAGALRSFGLAVPLLPCFIIQLFVATNLRPEVDTFHLFGAAAVAYALGWVMFPLLLIVIGRALERESQAIGAITFYNWFGAAITLVLTALHLLGAAGLLGDNTIPLMNLVLLGSLIFEVFALRVLLGVGYGGGILLVFLDMMLIWSLNYLLLSPLFQSIPT